MVYARALLRLTLLVVAGASLLVVAPATKYAPNHFLGKCLDDAWVKDVETKLSISAKSRDSQSRLEHPHLHAASNHRRYTIKDPRTTAVPMTQLYQKACGDGNQKFWGVGATVDGTTGTITDPGNVNGSLVLEMRGWASHKLATLVFGILAREVLGYEVSIFSTTQAALMGQRMSSKDTGLCSPIHINVEEWGRKYEAYMNEIYKSGAQGYTGRSGLYTTTDFVKKGTDSTQFTPPFSADFWRDYSLNDGLISALSINDFKTNADYYPPKENGCKGDFQGCLDSCSRTDTCTTRETVDNKDCLVIALMYADYDNGMLEAAMANNKVPSYHCFIGTNAIEAYAVDMEAKGKPVLFYHYEPDPFQFVHEGKFQRVFLPRAVPELTKLNTGRFGENGYGKATNNPASVDYPVTTLSKYGASMLQEHTPVATLLSRLSLEEIDMNDMLKSYVDITSRGGTALQPDDPMFSAACKWVRENYLTWKLWLDRPAVCTINEDMIYRFEHCTDGQPRQIVFRWIRPNPNNPDLPDTCDAGELEKPPGPIETSRSCEWLKANPYVWLRWIVELPSCDDSFYDFHVSACNAKGKRTAEYYWLLPNLSDSSLSRECQDGETLPDSVELDCEYTPFDSAIFQIAAAIAAVIATILLFMVGFVVHYRHEAIIKRSQYEFLVVMIAGGIMMCAAALLYAGEPTDFLCGARPVLTSMAFTCIFGSLVVKSLRVYRVFMSGAMKRVVLSTKTMFKILGMFVCVDLVILVAWFLFDFPSPYLREEVVGALNGGVVLHHVCMSSSFIFTALLIFWKAIVLFMGLYLSFLIRNVSTDFQESIWIFASSVVVLFGSLIILPMAYLVELPASVFYAFLSFMLLGCTALVMGMMLVPKITRLHEKASESVNETTTTNARESSRSESSARHSKGKVSIIRLPKKPKVQVTPVMEFRPKSKRSSKSKGKRKGNGDDESASSSD